MIVVSNTTPLIGLAAIQQFDLLQQSFSEVCIPQAVYAESVAVGREEGDSKHKVSGATWIRVLTVQDRLAVEVLLDELDLGEAEAIVLARELNADWVLMDERKARRKLAQLGINKIGTLGILLKAKQEGLLDTVRPEIEKLQQQSFRMSQSVIDAVLKQANE